MVLYRRKEKELNNMTKKEIEEKLEDLNEEARNWASMTPGGYSYLTVNAEGHIDLSVQSQGVGSLGYQIRVKKKR